MYNSEQISQLLTKIRDKSPLIHQITNYVTVNDCANITLAIGASPIMADDIAEAGDIASISNAVVLNIGTLNQRTIESMIQAGKRANSLDIPVVFDPVGAGASAFRNKTVEELIKQVKFAVVRGNLSEIRYIAGLNSNTKGVDASQSDLKSGMDSGISVAKTVAEKLSCIVAITGETDIISDGKKAILIKNGHPKLSAVTGTGCMCSALVGSACGAESDYFLAAVTGVAFMGMAGEVAFEIAGKLGTGSFRTAIIDQISELNHQLIQKRLKIYES